MDKTAKFLADYGDVKRIERQILQNDLVCFEIFDACLTIESRCFRKIQNSFLKHERCQKIVQTVQIY